MSTKNAWNVSETNPRSCGADQVEPGKALDNSTHLGEKTADRTWECDRSMKQSCGSDFVWFSNFLQLFEIFKVSVIAFSPKLGLRYALVSYDALGTSAVSIAKTEHRGITVQQLLQIEKFIQTHVRFWVETSLGAFWS